MESFPGPHNYMRPPLPPSSMADPNNQQPPPPPPQASSWFSPQFHYHPSHSPSPPPPPPPPQQHWGPLPPPPSDHNHAPLPYASHPNPPYPPHPYPNQYPPLQRPHMPPPPPYSNSSQDWGNQSWVPHAGWEHQAHNNGEDWAAKARAWAAAKNAMENQHPSVQSHYPSQYMPTSESHYHDNEQINVHSSTYQNYPAPAAPLDKQHAAHQPEPAAVSSVHAYYAPDGNFSYPRKDGKFSDAGTTYPQQDALMNPSVHKQEVPSSYSSIPGGQVSTEQPRGSGSGESMKADQSQQFSYGNQSVAVSVDPCDQPLQFTPRFNHDNNPMMLAGYPDPAVPAKVMGSVITLQPWTPPAPPSISFPSAPPAFPSAAQFDPTINMPPLAGQPPPMLGRAPVPSFHSTVSSLSPPIGLGTGTSVHPATAFHGDMYGTPMNSERPKKAAVPNWLRDEIIKKKDVIVSSGTDHHKEESESIDDELVDKSVRKIDQADSKSIDSSRSTEEEEDEDYEEVARTAAINQEIKRVLTEVLLKVTSDLFDEIATRVLDEDDNSIEAKNDTNAQNHKLSSPPAASASKVSEKALIPTKTNELKSEDVSEESSSGAAGNVLGLVNYASDDEEDIESSAVPKSNKSSDIKTSSKKFTEGRNGTVESCHSPPDSEKLNNNKVNAGNNHSVASSRGIDHNHASRFNDLVDHRSDKNGVGPPHLTKPVERKTEGITDHGRVIESFNDSREHNFSRKETNEPEAPAELVRKAIKDDFREKDTRRRDRHENKSSSARNSDKEADIIEARENNKGEQSHGRHDEKHQRKKNEDHGGSKERSKEQGVKYGEKTKEDSKKRSPHRHTKEVERHKKESEKDDVYRKSERSKDEKGDRSKHKHASDRARHKRRRSSSVDSRGRNSKDNSVASYSDNSTDEVSEKSRRKMHLKRRNLSPSPVRSRRRQVSQSPPSSMASQRRHSPYSSLEASRGRRSRSRSAHRRR